MQRARDYTYLCNGVPRFFSSITVSRPTSDRPFYLDINLHITTCLWLEPFFSATTAVVFWSDAPLLRQTLIVMSVARETRVGRFFFLLEI